MAPLEPWEKVHIQLGEGQSGFADIDPRHGILACSDCHQGKDPAEFEAAHDTAYGFMATPSDDADIACGPCHGTIVAGNKNSMHAMAWGERTAIAQRELGANADHQDFEVCPSSLVDGLNSECSSCHTTNCGQCHVSRPKSVGSGFIDSHRFSKIPDQANNCLACHGSRIGVDFRGELAGNKADAHYLNSMRCWDCHKENFHADASSYPSRYHLPDKPECTDCHADVASDNAYHTMHWPAAGMEGLACYVCHSQPYYNCDNCHTGGQWKEGYTSVGEDIHQGGGGYLEYPDFKIGLNYNPGLFEGKYITVRHIPVARDSYTPWGHATLSTYDSRPTWEYTSPHNIRRFTAQTDTTGGALCYENCHVEGKDGAMNAGRFLWQNFVESNYPDETTANAVVTVDGHLPVSWDNP